MISTISARVLGQRIRQLRTRRGMTQQDLAGEDYSKSYISAIEQGKTRPSLEALQRLASRLETPVGSLLDPEAPGFMPADPESMPRRVRRRRGVRAGQAGANVFDPAQQDLQLAQAELYIYSGQASQARDILRALLPGEAGTSGTQSTPGAPAKRPLDQSQLQKAYYLASLAAVQTGNTSEAVDYVQKGMQLATRSNDRETLEHLRLVLGMAYYHADQPLSALEQHRTCLEAVKADLVRDPNFKLRVLSNIAADYWALHDNERALGAYKQGLELLDELNSVERQAGIFWEGATHYSEERQYALAREAAAKAIGIYEALDNIQTVAHIESRYGNILIEAGELGQAEEYLRRGLDLTGGAGAAGGTGNQLGNPLDRAEAFTSLARLSLRQGDLDEAGSRVEQAVQTSREALDAASTGTGKTASKDKGKGNNSRSRAAEVLAAALTLQGEIATQKGDASGADQAFGEAIKLLEEGHAVESASDIYRRYAQALAGRGQHEQASGYFERAYEAITRRSR